MLSLLLTHHGGFCLIGWEQLDLRPRWQLGEIYAEGESFACSLKKTGDHPSLTAQVRNYMQGSH